MENLELVTTYRFKSEGRFVGIVGLKDPQIRFTPFEQHAVHHFETEFDWVCAKLKENGISYTFDKLTHFYSPQKNDR